MSDVLWGNSTKLFKSTQPIHEEKKPKEKREMQLYKTKYKSTPNKCIIFSDVEMWFFRVSNRMDSIPLRPYLQLES